MHTTQKPVQINQRLLTTFTKRGDIVVDLFLGSGGNMIAAEKTGRICYGMELDPKYISVILDRWQDYTGEEAIRSDGKTWNDLKNGV